MESQHLMFLSRICFDTNMWFAQTARSSTISSRANCSAQSRALCFANKELSLVGQRLFQTFPELVENKNLTEEARRKPITTASNSN